MNPTTSSDGSTSGRRSNKDEADDSCPASSPCEQRHPLDFEIKRGIPKYVGGDSLRTVCTIDSENQDSCDGVGTGDSSSGPSSDRQPQQHSKRDGCGAWVWKVASLPRVPEYAPLDRASLQVTDKSLCQITSIISDFMRLNSISCCYHEEEPGRVDCHTANRLKFVVQLWKAEDNQGILVEVQRRRGCGILMKHIRKSIYMSLESGTPHRDCCDMQLRRPSRDLQRKICNDLNEKDECQERRCSDAQFVCVELLESLRSDEQALGVECLVGLSAKNNPASTGISRALIYDEGSMAEELREAFLEIFCENQDIDDCFGMPTTSLAELSSHKVASAESHLMALQALVNCLDAIEMEEKEYLCNETPRMLDLGSPFWSKVFTVLIHDLHASSIRPEEASISARCIRILEGLNPETVTPFVESVVAPLLKTAYEFGKAHHLSLEKESEGLLLCCSTETSSRTTIGESIL